MADMTVVHEVSARADPREPAPLKRADIHRRAFANGAPLSDFKPGRFTAIAQILGRAAERRKRMIENIAVLRHLWTTNDVPFEGTYLRFPGVTMLPKPVQAPQS